MNQEFALFLENQKINSLNFFNQNPEEFLEWQKLFLKVHPSSFIYQKRFLINKMRHKFIGIPKEK